MKIADRKHEIRYGKKEPVGGREMAMIDDSIARTRAVNTRIWQVIRKHGFPL